MKKLYPILSIVILLFAVRSEKIEFEFKFISSYGDYNEYYNTKLTSLANRHSAKLFTLTDNMLYPEIFKPLLSSTIIIDTIVVERYRRNNDYFLKTASRSVNSLLCDLKCSKETYTDIGKNSNRHYLLAVKVNSVKAQQRVIELDSIDNKSLFVNSGHNVVLNGECLDAVELPYSLVFAND